MVSGVKMETYASDRLFVGLNLSLDADQAGTGDDCYWMDYEFCNGLAGEALLSDDSLILCLRSRSPVGFSVRGNKSKQWVQAAGPVPAICCLTIYQPGNLTL